MSSAGAPTGPGVSTPIPPYVAPTVPAADPGGVMPSGTVRDFLDSIGVNVHLFFTSSKVNAYEDHTAVRAALADMGLPFARDTYFNSATQRTRIRNIWQDLGIRWQLIFDSRIDSHVTTGNGHGANALDILTGSNLIETAAIEGSNEWDTQSSQGATVADRMTAARNEQINLWTAYDARTAMIGVPILTPSVADPQSAPLMGDLSTYSTHGNLHSYPGGFSPRANLKGSNQSLKGWISNVRQAAGAGRPVVATETGYHTNVPQLTGHLATSEAAQGVYSAQLPFEYWRQGVSRSFFYELFDQLNGTSGLSGVMSNVQTTLPLQPYPADWPTSGTVDVRIDNEVVRITAGFSTSSPTVTRNVTGSIGGAVSHAAFTTVSLVASSTLGVNQENRFGLKRYDRSDKPAATILKRIMSRLADTRRGLLVPLNFNLISTAGDTVRYVLLQASDGTWWLAVWNDVSIWDPTTGLAQAPGTVTATLNFHTPRSIEVYSPTVQTAAVDTAVGVTTRTLTLPAASIILVHIS